MKRSVRVSLTRQQMFSLCYRPITWQRVALGATHDGTLDAIIHEAVSNTSRYRGLRRNVVQLVGHALPVRQRHTRLQVAQLDLCTPSDMRGPGAAWGLYALECAMDELAVKLGIDPVELQAQELRRDGSEPGHAVFEQRACASATGRAQSVSDGRAGLLSHGRCVRATHWSVWGMATGVWEAWQLPASAKVRADRRRQGDGIERDGRHRNRHLHDHDADRRRGARAADRAGDVQARRLVVTAVHRSRAGRSRRRRSARRSRPSARRCANAVRARRSSTLADADLRRDVRRRQSVPVRPEPSLTRQASSSERGVRRPHSSRLFATALGGVRGGAGRRGPRHDPRHTGRHRGGAGGASSTRRRRAVR